MGQMNSHAPTYVNLLTLANFERPKFARTKNLDKLIAFVHWGAEIKTSQSISTDF